MINFHVLPICCFSTLEFVRYRCALPHHLLSGSTQRLHVAEPSHALFYSSCSSSIRRPDLDAKRHHRRTQIRGWFLLMLVELCPPTCPPTPHVLLRQYLCQPSCLCSRSRIWFRVMCTLLFFCKLLEIFVKGPLGWHYLVFAPQVALGVPLVSYYC